MTRLQFILLAPAALLLGAAFGTYTWFTLAEPKRAPSPDDVDEYEAWLAAWRAQNTDAEALGHRNQE